MKTLLLVLIAGGTLVIIPTKQDDGRPLLQPDVQTFRRVSIASEAYALALLDLQTIPEERWPYTRWVWECEPTAELVKASCLTLNYISRANILYRPTVLANGHLIRVDLSAMAAQFGGTKSLQEISEAWEQLRFDPSFALLLTAGTIVSGDNLPPMRMRTPMGFVESPATDHLDPDTGEITADVVRFDGPHLDLAATWELQDSVVSQAPIVEAGYFARRALTAIQDDGPWKIIYGGLYYDFIGVKESKDPNKTDQDLFFESLGIPNDELARNKQGRLRGIQLSDVTGKVRQWELLWGRNTNPKAGICLVGITFDVKTKSIRAAQNARLNLLEHKPDAFEVMFTRDNGLIGGILFDLAKKLQREVPPDIAANREIPSPHDTRLEPVIGCLQCHLAKGHDGWIPIHNDVDLLRTRLDIFGDLKAKTEATALLAGLFVGSPDKTLRRAREDQQEAVLRVVDTFGPSNLTVVKDAAVAISERYNAHRYGRVGAVQALAECGVRTSKERAVAMLQAFAVRGAMADARIGTIEAGGSVTREEWDAVKSIVAARVRAMLELPMPKETK